MDQHVSKNVEEWRETTARTAREKTKQRREDCATRPNIEVPDLATAEDLQGVDMQEQLGYPGEFPFTRGIHPDMYRSHLWTMRQYAGFGTAEESNKRYHFLLSHGTTGLSVAFDLPTQMGYDPDHPLAEGEVGKVGVSIASLEDMETLLHGLPLEQVSTSMTINATASVLLALYIAVAKKQGVDVRKLSGTVQNDILKEYTARGTYIYPPQHSMRIITDIFSFCGEHVPRWNTISISGYHIREAGATAIQELAFTIADGIRFPSTKITTLIVPGLSAIGLLTPDVMALLTPAVMTLDTTRSSSRMFTTRVPCIGTPVIIPTKRLVTPRVEANCRKSLLGSQQS